MLPFSNRVKTVGRLTAGASAKLSERSSDILSGILTIKEYQLNEVLSGKFRTTNEDYAGKSLDRERIGAFLEAMNSGFTVLCSIVFLVAGSVMVQSGKTNLWYSGGTYESGSQYHLGCIISR